MKMNELREKIAEFPDSPGVYLMKDNAGGIIYIGKAKSLKKRVQSYFNRYLDSKTQALVAKIFDIEYKLTPTESQAQILESSLIKKNQPQYNIDLKDDKSFPWVRITAEEFPVVSIHRRKKILKNDKARYFGPYTNVKLLRQALKFLRVVFGFRSCRIMPKQACLYYRLNLCPAPCISAIDRQGYSRIMENICLAFEAKTDDLVKRLTQEMNLKSKNHEFEQAAKIRDQINALGSIGGNVSLASRQNELADLKRLLKLNKFPERIEAFDISNISGKESCGSMVSFYKGGADKNNYRRFRIKAVEGIDDYAMIREIVRRRYSRIVQENLKTPDLVLIDGGRSHLSVAEDELKKLNLNLSVMSIAKDRENIYLKGRSRPIQFKEDTPALNLIRRIRDEAHRFAIAYHHVLRRKKIIGK